MKKCIWFWSTLLIISIQCIPSKCHLADYIIRPMQTIQHFFIYLSASLSVSFQYFFFTYQASLQLFVWKSLVRCEMRCVQFNNNMRMNFNGEKKIFQRYDILFEFRTFLRFILVLNTMQKCKVIVMPTGKNMHFVTSNHSCQGMVCIYFNK